MSSSGAAAAGAATAAAAAAAASSSSPSSKAKTRWRAVAKHGSEVGAAAVSALAAQRAMAARLGRAHAHPGYRTTVPVEPEPKPEPRPRPEPRPEPTAAAPPPPPTPPAEEETFNVGKIELSVTRLELPDEPKPRDTLMVVAKLAEEDSKSLASPLLLAIRGAQGHVEAAQRLQAAELAELAERRASLRARLRLQQEIVQRERERCARGWLEAPRRRTAASGRFDNFVRGPPLVQGELSCARRVWDEALQPDGTVKRLGGLLVGRSRSRAWDGTAFQVTLLRGLADKTLLLAAVVAWRQARHLNRLRRGAAEIIGRKENASLLRSVYTAWLNTFREAQKRDRIAHERFVAYFARKAAESLQRLHAHAKVRRRYAKAMRKAAFCYKARRAAPALQRLLTSAKEEQRMRVNAEDSEQMGYLSLLDQGYASLQRPSPNPRARTLGATTAPCVRTLGATTAPTHPSHPLALTSSRRRWAAWQRGLVQRRRAERQRQLDGKEQWKRFRRATGMAALRKNIQIERRTRWADELGVVGARAHTFRIGMAALNENLQGQRRARWAHGLAEVGARARFFYMGLGHLLYQRWQFVRYEAQLEASERWHKRRAMLGAFLFLRVELARKRHQRNRVNVHALGGAAG